MATCKECVHYKLCDYKAWQKAILSRDVSDCMYIALNVVCEFFKSKEDVQEVKHGEWIVTEDDYGICATEFTCSHCKVSLVTSELTDGQFLDMMKYCPNCGAEMKGGV